MRRGSRLLLCLLSPAVLACGGSNGAGRGGAGGSAGAATGGAAGGAGSAGPGGAPGAGLAGATGTGGGAGGPAGAGGGAGTGGHAAQDAGADAAGGGAACAVTVDGGMVACTTALVAANEYDIFCGFKAGTVRCWSSSTDSFFLGTLAPAAADAPPGLAQLAITDSIVDTPLFCGVDAAGAGSCWQDAHPTALGTGLRAASLSRYGACALHEDGTVTCANTIIPPPSGHTYAQIVVSEDLVATLDTAGVPSFEGAAFPDGVYAEIAANNGRRVAAVRSDGAAVSIWNGADVLVKTGPFVHVAVDDSSRACALDAAGEITCWSLDGASAAPFSHLPSGPFGRIVGAASTFCALRTIGTTVCWGDTEIDVPPGW